MEIVQDEIVFNKTVEKKVIYTVQIGCGYKRPQNESEPTRCVSCSKNFFVKITKYGRHEGRYSPWGQGSVALPLLPRALFNATHRSSQQKALITRIL